MSASLRVGAPALLGASLLLACSQTVGTSEPDDARLVSTASAPLVADGVVLGRGYDFVTGDMLGDCTTSTGNSLPSGVDPTAQSASVAFEYVESSAALQELLALPASTVSAGIADPSFHDTKWDFAKRQTFDGSSIHAYISIRTTHFAGSLVGVALTPDARAILEGPNGPRAFRTRCGDGFVSANVPGAELFGVAVIAISSSADADDMKQQVDSYVTAGTSGGGTAQGGIGNDTTRVSIDEYVRGAPSSTRCLSLACLLAQAKSFEATEAQSNESIDFGALPYTVLDLPPGAATISPWAARWTIEDLVADWNARSDRLAGLGYVVAHPTEFSNPAIATYRTAIANLESDLALLRTAVAACRSDITTCARPPGLSALVYLPARIR